MSFITTYPNPYLVNVPELQSVLTSATGNTGEVVTFTEYVDTTTNSATFNSIGSYDSGTIAITNDLYLSNSAVYVNDSPVIVSNNTLNGNLYTAMTVNNSEIARFNSNGIGIFTQSPAAALHVNGSAVFASTIYVSSFGVTATPSVGNIIADGYVQANGIVYPSDPSLKNDIKPYISNNLPRAVEFVWKSTGERDIGVLATEVADIEPVCVRTLSGSRNNTLAVDYSKLVVLCISQIEQMKEKIETLENEIEHLRKRLV
jgi:hypothetical protein